MKTLFAKTILATLLTTTLVGCEKDKTPPVVTEAITVTTATVETTPAPSVVVEEPVVVETATVSNAEKAVDTLPEWYGTDGPDDPHNLKGEKIEGNLYRSAYGEAVYEIEEGDYGINSIPSILQSLKLDNKYNVMGPTDDTYILLNQEDEAGRSLIGGKVIIRGSSDRTCNVVYGVSINNGEVAVQTVNLETSCLKD